MSDGTLSSPATSCCWIKSIPCRPDRKATKPFPVLDFHIQNSDTKAHVVWMLLVPQAAAATPIAGGAVPAGSTFIGLATVPGTPKADNPGNADMWLTNLGPGTYTFTDLSNAAMFSTFTVTAPPAATPAAGTPAA